MPAEATPAPAIPAKKLCYITPSPIGVNDFLILGRKGSEEAAKKHNASLKILESEDPICIKLTMRKERLCGMACGMDCRQQAKSARRPLLCAILQVAKAMQAVLWSG